ncbi:MAG TPA: TrkH family potassium uptake protein [Gammaproteobacteria bacterium]|nr:TrkH family potassium uptake protein [Gammaproteobacteria bacterium]
MHLGAVQRVLGLMLTLFGLTLAIPMLVYWYYGDGALMPFVYGFAIIVGIGVIAWATAWHGKRDLQLRDGFLIVALIWVLCGVLGALPFWFAASPDMSFTDAVFETVSGLTTTGATVLVTVEKLPHSILYYRQQLHWFGGMGIIVLALAVLPILGVGGMQLYRAETPGPVKDKLTPRVTETAKALWLIYLGITFACAMSYWLAGMSLFDAIGNSFATVATGGFSMHDASFAYYHSNTLELIGAFFMFVSGANFALHFGTLRSGSIKTYFRDPEFRFYLGITMLLVGVMTADLYLRGVYPTMFKSFVESAFQYTSMMTTTGFLSADFTVWPGFIPMMLILVGFMGACVGSTTGGLKVLRIHLMTKQALREIQRLLHPSAEIPVKSGGSAVSNRVIQGVLGFVATYFALFAIMMMILLATGLTPVEAFTGLATCMNNVGPALGSVAFNFHGVGIIAKWTLIVAMLLGRLEIYPLLVLFTPVFWRR